MEDTDRLERRGAWGNWSEFLFAFLGAIVGYGNIWRFPYICYRNGGGAFLIPFFIAMFVCAVPLLFLETLISQYSHYGPARVFELCPLFKGLGYSIIILAFMMSIYYTMIIAWTIYYLVNSFSNPVPWSTCDNDWNTVNCSLSFNKSTGLDNNASLSPLLSAADDNSTKVTPAEEFWFNKAIDSSPGIDTLGVVQWQLVLSLLAAWTAVFLCLVKGIKGLGKIAYVAASLPFIILACLLIRGLMLPGSGNGLYYFFVPRWESLSKLTVWRDAATQMFYSVGLAGGSVGTLTSYNKFHNNCFRDSIIMPILDSVTSVFAGMVIFAFLGYTAHITDKAMEDVVAQGPGLVFIVYPSALATLPLPQLWSVLFFTMLFTMGLDSQFVNVQVLTTGLMDTFPKLLGKQVLVTFLVCAASFLLGLPLTTQAGVYILNLLDWYMASVTLLLASAITCFVLGWIYGVDRVYSNVEHMIGYRPPIIFRYAWRVITPGFVLFLWITGFVFFQPISVKLSGFNQASDIAGIILAIFPFCAVPVVAVWQLYIRKGSFKQRLGEAIKPTSLWRPAIMDVVKDQDANGIHEDDMML